jgi:quinolinate synthase
MAHPECPPEVVALADVAVSTSGMIRYAQKSAATDFIVGTEVGMRYPLEKACPGKTFHMVSPRMHCDDMKKISLADIVRCLETMAGEVKVPEEIRVPALKAVQRMVDLSI